MKISIKSIIRVIAMMNIIFAMNVSYAQTTTATINYNASGLVPGAIIEVPVVFTSTANVGAWQVMIYYNRDVLTYNSILPGAAWTGFPVQFNSNFLISGTSPQYPNDRCLKVGWGSTSSSVSCNPSIIAFKIYFTYNGGNTNLEVINKNLTATGTGAFSSYIKQGAPSVIYTGVQWTNGSTAGPLAPITSVSGGGNWSAAASWDLGHKPNTSNGTVTVNSDMATPLILDADVTTATDLIVNPGKALTVSSGKALNVTGNFTIKDGGSYLNYGSGPTSGTVERIIAKNNNWHFLASPVEGAAIKPNFAPVVADNTFDFYKWDETINMAALPWINIRNTSGAYAAGFDNFELGRGYLVAYSSSYSGSATHTFTGALTNIDKTVIVSNSNNHFNLIGNPYQSAIDWDNASLLSNAIATFGVNPTIRIWNEVAGQYGVYSNGLSLSGASNIIAPNQAFFVEAIAAGNFVIPNAARVHGSQAFLKSTAANMLKLNVSTTANTYSDEMIVRFDDNNISDGVAKWPSLIAAAPSLYSVKNNENLTINNLTSINGNLVVPVGFKAGVNGTYSIKASYLNSFATPTYVYLKDIKTNIITDMNQNMYNFAASTTDNSDRFELIFALSPLGVSNNVIENTSVYSYDNTIYVNSNENIKQIAIYNTLGQLIKLIENKSGLISVNMNGNPSAYYIVRVVSDKNTYSEKVFVK